MNLEPLATPALMLDISKYDGREILTEKPFSAAYHTIDWSRARAKWPAVLIKQGEGLDPDELFHDQFKAAEGQVWRGIYHFFKADTNAIKSAHACADAAEKAGGYGELGVFLDIEKNSLAVYLDKKGKRLKTPELHGTEYMAGVASWLYEMNKRMQAFGSQAPLGIYTRASFWDELYEDAKKPGWAAKYPVWVARYDHDVKDDATKEEHAAADAKTHAVVDGALALGKPSLPEGFKTLFAWQWTAKGRPDQIEGYPPYKLSVDLNFLYFGPSAKA